MCQVIHRALTPLYVVNHSHLPISPNFVCRGFRVWPQSSTLAPLPYKPRHATFNAPAGVSHSAFALLGGPQVS